MRDLKSWRATGTLTVEVGMGGSVSRTESAFTMTKVAPDLMRLDVTGSPPSTSIVCDGESLWVELPERRRYTQSPQLSSPGCSPAAPWPDLLQDAGAVSLRGSETVEIGGIRLACEVVEVALSELPVLIDVDGKVRRLRIAQGTRTLCIDRTRRVVLRDELRAILPFREIGTGAAQLSTVTTYRSFERDPDLPRDLFRLKPSANSSEGFEHLVPQRGALAAGPLFVARDDSGLTAPRAVHKVQHQYSAQARRDGIQGAVVLGLVVGTDGLAQQVRVLRHLDPGLDKQAIKAVNLWRFEPARRGGKPVAWYGLVELNFRLPHP
jgi:TonB family protein